MEVDLGGVSRIRTGCGGLLTVVCRYTQYSGKWDEAYERLMNGRGACGLSVGRRVMKACRVWCDLGRSASGTL